MVSIVDGTEQPTTMNMDNSLKALCGKLSKEQLEQVVVNLSKHTSIDSIIAEINKVANDDTQMEIDGGSLRMKHVICKENHVVHKQPQWSKKKKQKRPFDMSRYHKRHIALKFLYFGENFYGFQQQENASETIENKLFTALKKTRLVIDIQDCSYTRCGRTDKGVSAYGQVIGIYLRSFLQKDQIIVDKEKCLDDLVAGNTLNVMLPNGEIKKIEEIDYCTVINSALPPEIRVIAWSPAPENFNARFSALYRRYKFYFVKKNLDLERMQEGANRLIGLHDYRNFCQMDENIINFVRRIYTFDVKKCSENVEKNSFYQICQFEICGQSFLWHQVRCMVSILFLIGRGVEMPSVIDKMLDPEATPRKPQYELASDMPLVLHECAFENIEMRYHPNSIAGNYNSLEKLWEASSIRTALLRNSLESVKKCLVYNDVAKFHMKVPDMFWESDDDEMTEWSALMPFSKFTGYNKRHIPLMDRRTGISLDEKISRCENRKKNRLAKDDQK